MPHCACHAGPCRAGIALSPDGLQVAVGTESGALSLLDIATQQCSTLLRSHTAAVCAVALVPGIAEGQAEGRQQALQQQYCTAGADGTVRVRDGATHHQVLELSSPGETVLRWVDGWVCWQPPLCHARCCML